MLIGWLASPPAAAAANAIQVFTFLGVFWTAWVIRRDRQYVTIVARSADGREKIIGRTPRRFVTRAEVMGCVSMKAGRDRLDFTGFDPDYKFKGDRVVVDLEPLDFDKLQAAA